MLILLPGLDMPAPERRRHRRLCVRGYIYIYRIYIYIYWTVLWRGPSQSIAVGGVVRTVLYRASPRSLRSSSVIHIETVPIFLLLFVIPHRRETIKQPVYRRRGVVPLPEE